MRDGVRPLRLFELAERHSLVTALALGVLSALAFEPVGWWPLMLLALAVLCELLLRSKSLRRALLLGWLFGLGQFVIGLNWIATAFTYQAAMPAWLGWIAVVLLSLYLAVYPALAAGLGWRLGGGRRGPLLLALAGGWGVTEWLRGGIFTGFSWNPVGVVLADTSLLQSSALIGTYGLSMLVVLIGGALWLAVHRTAWPALAVAAVVVLLWAFPASRVPTSQTALKPVRIVQPNIGQQDKWRPGFSEIAARRLARLSAPRHPDAGPRLLLWPEAAVTEPLEDARTSEHQAYAEFERTRAASLLAPGEYLLTGGIALHSSDGRRVDGAANSVFVIGPGGQVLGRYDKAHLVPYGEYLPMRPLLSSIGLSRLAPGDVDFAPGPGPRTLNLPGWGKVGFQLCYEIIFPGHVVDRRNRPDFIFNPSNDAWFGRWGPPQHLAQARLRAAEEGIPVLRSTPTGISAIIDARGAIVAAQPWRTAGAIDGVLPPPALGLTPFARAGNWIALLLALGLILAAIALRTGERYRRT
nr:apolipoprotein N-acyltransferase [Sphingomonas sp.]